MRSLLLVPFLTLTLPAQDAPATQALSESQQAQGWVSLFDGEDIGAWRGFRKDGFPAVGWVVADGTLQRAKGAGGGDLITRRQFGDFELELQFRTTNKANSGILYLVTEQEDQSYWTGAEFQVLDDEGAGVTADAATSAGALYGLVSPKDKTLRPAGQWNDARVVVRAGNVEHWLNGTRIVTANLNSQEWRDKVNSSKFAKWRHFAKATRGHICLQDHGDPVAYRDIRIRELPPASIRRGAKVALFDGSDLSAWDCFLRDDGKKDEVWRIEDGVLVCTGKPRGYLYTKDKYDNFILRLKWRFDPAKGAGNSGVLLRATGEHKTWPRSIEAQLHSGNAGDFWNIGEVPMQTDKSRQRRRNTKKSHGNEKPLGQWNDYEIIVDGPWVRLSVNGEVLNEAWGCEVIPGHIGLQSEGAEIHFRDIELIPLR